MGGISKSRVRACERRSTSGRLISVRYRTDCDRVLCQRGRTSNERFVGPGSAQIRQTRGRHECGIKLGAGHARQQPLLSMKRGGAHCARQLRSSRCLRRATRCRRKGPRLSVACPAGNPDEPPQCNSRLLWAPPLRPCRGFVGPSSPNLAPPGSARKDTRVKTSAAGNLW
jgi:hypothetical protein